ncbi:hypothetical protein M427DRAFT_390891 [Gonapodya prolifera JEL478]|uniref:Uncharacterized protein n=1 Tax=Gonapodya prolifera (strain JEL478) TaxID=1344416 RepID=A0A139A8H9_GONPJ|nr:hypothetical protein M427DRAFT_390891 [Gonapodya prolifera JEL478]|eukprot:KXS12693.1 hypothetical protein M427DRAFT_390891 [Gonapodya prolifera JEL478]
MLISATRRHVPRLQIMAIRRILRSLGDLVIDESERSRKMLQSLIDVTSRSQSNPIRPRLVSIKFGNDPPHGFPAVIMQAVTVVARFVSVWDIAGIRMPLEMFTAWCSIATMSAEHITCLRVSEIAPGAFSWFNILLRKCCALRELLMLPSTVMCLTSETWNGRSWLYQWHAYGHWKY